MHTRYRLSVAVFAVAGLASAAAMADDNPVLPTKLCKARGPSTFETCHPLGPLFVAVTARL